MANEQTEIERLTEAAEQIKADLAAAKLLAEQRENLLPKLEKLATRLGAKHYAATQRLQEVQHAVADIMDGVPTTYRLRGPRKKKTTEGAE